jgi:hypothetical protein
MIPHAFPRHFRFQVRESYIVRCPCPGLVIDSILADPRDPEMNAKVNNAVKFRECWRPVARSMLSERAGEYLESATDSPFMVLTVQERAEKRGVIPSVTHVHRRPVVMNTSFNLRGEPIVCAPADAVRTFFSSVGCANHRQFRGGKINGRRIRQLGWRMLSMVALTGYRDKPTSSRGIAGRK